MSDCEQHRWIRVKCDNCGAEAKVQYSETLDFTFYVDDCERCRGKTVEESGVVERE